MAFINGFWFGERLNGTNSNDTIYGNGGNDTLNGGTGNDTLSGGTSADSLFGGGGDDGLYGGTGNDYLNGGFGNDYLEGGSGADTYYFARGLGQDVINNNDYDSLGYNTDRIQFGNDILGRRITPSDILVSKNGDDLVLKIKNTTDQITVSRYFYQNASSPYAIENIYFANGTVWNIDTVKQKLTNNLTINGNDSSESLAGDAGNDTINGNGGNDALYGNAGNDTLNGGAGNDYLLGRAGNDSLEGGVGNDSLDGGLGNDVIKGGVGNDFLYGDDGADVYHFARGDGQDIIENYNTDAIGVNLDTLQFANGINEADIVVSQNDNDLVLSIKDTTDSIRINNYFYNNGNSSYLVENITFANGVTWSINTIKQKLSEPKTLNGSNNNDTLTGGMGNDTIRGNGGNDYLMGKEGADLLEGGAGSDYLDGGIENDTLNGGAGNDILVDDGGVDTFIFERGSGADTIYNYNPTTNNAPDVLLMGANITINDISIRRNYNDLVISINGTNDQVTVQSYFYADAYKVSEIRFTNGTALSRFDIEERLLVGTEGSDEIYGNSANNNLKGLGGNDTLNGSAGHDTLEGGAGYDYLYGDDGNDSLLGGAGDDYLQGGYGNNTLDGGAGNDVYYGGRGDDTFIFTKGSGEDTIYNYNSFGTDAVRDKVLLQGLLKTDVTLTRNNYDLEVTVNGTNGADKLIIPNYFYANFANNNCDYAISRLVFADGSEYNASQIRDLVANGQSVIEGSPNNDVLIGSSLNETLRGNDKDDTLLAYEGNDSLLGNNGKDSLYGGQGNDTLEGGAGNDWLQGDLGADVYRFGRGSGQDTIYNFDEDALNTNADRIVLADGIAESDVTVSKDGEDLILTINNTSDSLRIQNYLRNNSTTAFAIESIVFASGATWTINTIKQKLSPNGNLLLEGGVGNDTLTAGAGQDTLIGGAGNDQLYGGTGNDLLEAGLGNDKLYGEVGNDTLIGGAGNDSYYLDDADTIIENANEGTDTLYVSSTVVAAGTDYQMVDNLENVVVTGTQSLRVLGNASNNNMIANNAGGLLFGGAGNDTLLGGTAQDLLIGGDGDDLVEGGIGDDRLQGNNGNNILRGGDGSDYYIMSNLLNINETGLDIIQNYDNDAINTNADRIQLFDITSDKITLKREADHLLIQSSPTKTIRVENYFASEGATSAAVEWIDFVDFAQNKIVESWDIATVKAKVLLGTSANEALTGYSSDDVLKGNSGDDTLNGKGGNDIIEGEIGNDTLLGEEGNDVLNGGAGADTLNGGLGNDVLGGGVGNDSLLGGDGNDIFDGGVGADTMEGGAGDDIYAVDDVGDVVTETVAGVSTAGNIIRVSTTANGTQANAASYAPVFSPDGNKVLFRSNASNLVTGDTSQNLNIFIKNLKTGEVQLVDNNNSSGNSYTNSDGRVFSPDGTKVAFWSSANNLVAGDNNNVADVFMKDINTGTISRISVAANGGQANGESGSGIFSSDGKRIIFSSAANNLVANDTNGVVDIFMKNIETGVVTRVNTASNGTQANGLSFVPVFSPDGTKVAFISYASNLVAGDTNGAADIFVKDLTTGAISRVSTTINGLQGNYDSFNPSFSADGTKISFYSHASNLVANDTNGSIADIFVKDLATGAVTLASSSSEGVAGNSSSYNALFSSTGNKIVFYSHANNLVANDTNGAADVFVKDLTTGQVSLVSKSVNGLQTNQSDWTDSPIFSADGNKVAFFSFANNLVQGDTNYAHDIFIKDLTGTPTDAGGIDTVQSSISYTLGQFIENLTLTGTGNLNATGNELANTLTGNGGNNRLDGGTGADTLKGGAGNDVYVVDNAGDVVTENANEGTDTVESSLTHSLGNNLENLTLTGTGNINGTGNDLANMLTGNGGNNRLDGGIGADTLKGGAGNDVYVVDNAGDVVTENANEGTDTVESSLTHSLGNNLENLTLTGSDSLNGTGNALANTLTGNGGNNRLDGGAGADTLKGGAGNDVYVVDNAGDVVTENANEGIDTIESSVAHNLGNNLENLTVTGTGNVNATGNELANTLTGNSGNNRLDGGAGADTLKGGAGNDVYVVDNAGDTVIENASEGTDTVESSLTHSLGNNLENLTLTGTGNLNGTGNDLANTLTGNGSNNRLDGGTGADTLKGGAGNDTYVVDNAGDVVIEEANAGTDTVESSITYTLGANLENLTLTIGGLVGTGNALNNLITSTSSMGNQLIGAAGNDTLLGGAGQDLLEGGVGADRLEGGFGDDVYRVDVTDTIVEAINAGTDTVEVDFSYTLLDNFENLTLFQAQPLNINGTGNALNNQIIGNGGNNSLTGAAGNDTLIGGKGNDTLNGGIGNDLLQGDEGNDVLTGGDGNDTLIGGEGNDSLTGGIGDDVYSLTGAFGQDVVNDISTSSDLVTLNMSSYRLDQLALLQSGSDLRITVKNTTNVLTVKGFFDYANRSAYQLILSDQVLNQPSPASDTPRSPTGPIFGGGIPPTTDGSPIPIPGIPTNHPDKGPVIRVPGATPDADVFIPLPGYLPSGAPDYSFVLPDGTVLTKADIMRLLGFSLPTEGNDTINGGATDDNLVGNGGHDVIDGKDGNDNLSGGLGNDTLKGGAGNDILRGGDGNDVLEGGVGNDTLLGEAGNDTLRGGDGNDVLEGGVGADSMEGGAGDDIYVIDNVGDTVNEVINDISRVNTAANGEQGNSSSYGGAIFSPDGSKVLFNSHASNLVANDTNDAGDVFIKDLTTGSISRVNTAANGGQGNSSSEGAIFSPDGSKVLFRSDASNLVANDTNDATDIFIKDLTTGSISRVNTAANGEQGNSSSYVGAIFSPDGKKVLFTSNASNLVANDTNKTFDIFIKDLTTGSISRVNTAANGEQGNRDSYDAIFSPDGSKVLFVSGASNLVANDTNDTYDVFIKDLTTGSISRVSTAADGAQGNSSSYGGAIFSPDGSKVLFVSGASNLVANDTNDTYDVFIKDLTTGSISRVSTAANGEQGNSSSYAATFSPDGSKVLFISDASNLVANDTNNTLDIFIKDLTTGSISRVNTAANGGQGNSSSEGAIFSPDGSKVLFTSYASNLVANDTNGTSDIFIKDLTSSNFRAEAGGIDTVQSSISYTLGRLVENLTLTGTGNINGTGNELANTLTGNSGNNRLEGAAGNDTLIGGAGNDTLVGGAGNDTYIVGTNTIIIDSGDATSLNTVNLSAYSINNISFAQNANHLVISQANSQLVTLQDFYLSADNSRYQFVFREGTYNSLTIVKPDNFSIENRDLTNDETGFAQLPLDVLANDIALNGQLTLQSVQLVDGAAGTPYIDNNRLVVPVDEYAVGTITLNYTALDVNGQQYTSQATVGIADSIIDTRVETTEVSFISAADDVVTLDFDSFMQAGARVTIDVLANDNLIAEYRTDTYTIYKSQGEVKTGEDGGQDDVAQLESVRLLSNVEGTITIQNQQVVFDGDSTQDYSQPIEFEYVLQGDYSTTGRGIIQITNVPTTLIADTSASQLSINNAVVDTQSVEFSSTPLDLLLQSMASLTPSTMGQTVLNSEQNQALSTVLSTTWTNS